MYPDVCLCDEGWQGEICNLGLCSACTYGLCSGPEICECFYGYEGVNCDIPISTPPCLHGHAVTPNVCDCDEGWDGRICDKALCSNECGDHGHCVMPEYCECDPAWYSSDVTSQCDLLNPLAFDQNCVAADTERCLECDYEHYWDPETFLCHLCSQAYDSMCVECDELQCLEC